MLFAILIIALLVTGAWAADVIYQDYQAEERRREAQRARDVAQLQALRAMQTSARLSAAAWQARQAMYMAVLDELRQQDAGSPYSHRSSGSGWR